MQPSVVETLRRKLLNMDPGYLNLRSAVRGTLAVVAVYFILSTLARRFAASPSLPFLGVLITMMASIAIAEPKKSQQKTTTLIMPIPAFAAAAASVSFAGWPYGRLAGFLAVTFAAVSIRRYGPRWAGLGIITFMAYFATLFFPFHAADIPWILAAIALGAAVTFVTRFWLLPDRAEHIIGLYLQTFDIRISIVLDRLATALDSSAHDAPVPITVAPDANWMAVRQAFVDLNELSVALEQLINTGDNKSLRTHSASSQLKIFEHEMALRRLWDYSFELIHENEDHFDLLRSAAAAVRLLRKPRLPLRKEPGRVVMPIEVFESKSNPAVLLFRDAVNHTRSVLDTVEFSPSEVQAMAQDVDDREVRSTLPSHDEESLHINTRQAIQATLATAFASIIGTTVSPDRWYWASISAFMVFIGASRGETMIRGVLRISGTVLGLLLGFGLAFAFSGHRALEWTLVVGCVFFGIFGSRFSFGFWSAGLFSSMFALLYDILGLLNKPILYLRLEETLIGALIGIIVAAIILPTSTHSALRKALSEFLGTAGSIVASLPKEAPNPFARRNLIRQLRALDKQLMDLRLAAAPIVGRGSLMKQREIPAALHDATILAHYIRHLSINIDPRAEMSDQKFLKSCLEVASLIEHTAIGVTAPDRVTENSALPWSGRLPENRDGPKHALERIRVSVASIANRKL